MKIANISNVVPLGESFFKFFDSIHECFQKKLHSLGHVSSPNDISTKTVSSEWSIFQFP